MVEQQKRSNIFIALLLSFLTALAGGILFGIIYGLGYYIYLLALVEIVLAVSMYLNFAERKCQAVVTATIWSMIWTFLFNILAVGICEALFLAIDFGMSFTDALNTVVELWKTNAEVRTYVNNRIFEIFDTIIIGGIVYGIYFIAKFSKEKKANKQNEKVQHRTQANIIDKTTKTTTSVEVSNHLDATQIYLEAYKDCRSAIIRYTKSKDLKSFTETLKKIKTKHNANIDNETKQEIIELISKISSKDDLSALAKKTNETLLKIFK